jgi:hypothetical protein
MKLQVLPVEQQLLDQLYLAATATPGVYTIVIYLLECSVQVATEITLRLSASSRLVGLTTW